jgi:uncharacterized protein (TIGR03067 family)
MERFLVAFTLLLGLAAVPSPGIAADPELDRIQGRWEVMELAEDGRIIPPQTIQQWLPSGGRVEIIDNAIVFQSPTNGTKSAKTFRVNPTTFPKRLDIITGDTVEAVGIYQLDQGKLVICLVAPTEARRPTEFAAPAGSKRMLMVLRRPVVDVPPPPSAPPLVAAEPKPMGVGGTTISDDQMRRMLPGTWKFNDTHGAMIVVAAADGTYQTVREVQEIRLFQQVFVRTPVSSGTWTVKDGQLQMRIGSSTATDRVGRTVPLYIRSITDKDLIFVDMLGRVGSAVKVQ